MSPDAIEGYAIGYFHGRAYGTDEAGLEELAFRFKNHSNYEEFKHGFKHGYDRGVTDFLDYDDLNYAGLHDDCPIHVPHHHDTGEQP